MRLALRQARRALGRTWPNPPVGAVLYRGARVLGLGATQPPGGPHAEIVAVRRATRDHGARALRGATLAMTLEPCNHHGRTPPCSRALVEAGVARVYAGHRDPNPTVAGRGASALRAAGIRVEIGVLEAECREQHRGFLSVVQRGRPFVSLKLAATLDGRIATAGGESRWITGPAARAEVHRLRERADALMVGSGTALADDPALTARRGARVVRRPVRVLVDSRLRVPVRAHLYRGEGAAWVVCARGAHGRHARNDAGARVLEVRRRGEHVDLRAALARLAREGLTDVLVEGGAGLAAALLRDGLVDEIHWFVAPTLLGGDGRAALAGLGIGRLADAPALEDVRWRFHERDLHLAARIAGRRRGERRKA
jgi:diaminohydroxyphosphoribosylaminopyrimidine deaminase/5-amino-6-(5-phosphoribosylamino)uracil reductase